MSNIYNKSLAQKINKAKVNEAIATPVDQDSFLLDTNDVAHMLHLSKRTLQELRSAGVLPYVRPTNYRCYYHPIQVALVHKFIQSRKEARRDN